MACSRELVILFLWTLHCEGTVNVQQESLIQTAFANEQVNTTCKTTFPYQPEYTDFEIIYYHMNSEGKKTIVYTSKFSETIPPGKENQTDTKSHRISIKPKEHTSASGVYYCHAKWKHEKKEGKGTFILFRDKGYIKPPLVMWIFLIILTMVLATVSILVTVLLFWKREVVCLERKQVKKHPGQGPEPASHIELPESIYAALGPHEPDIYTVFEDQSLRKENPTPKVSYQETEEEIVYENF